MFRKKAPPTGGAFRLFLPKGTHPPRGIVALCPVVMLIDIEHAAIIGVSIDLAALDILTKSVCAAVGLQVVDGHHILPHIGEVADQFTFIGQFFHHCAVKKGEAVGLPLVGDAFIIPQCIATVCI